MFIGLYFLILPGAANLLNSSFGRRFALLRWGLVVVNAGMTALWCLVCYLEGLNTAMVFFLLIAAEGVLTLLSFSLARSWGRASKEAKEAT